MTARCDTRITVGVTSPALLTKKLLPELIQPVEERIQSVDTFISQVTPDPRLRTLTWCQPR